jgi:hypothetical protein
MAADRQPLVSARLNRWLDSAQVQGAGWLAFALVTFLAGFVMGAGL